MNSTGDVQPNVDQLKKSKELLDAQKAVADAQKGLADAQTQATVAQQVGTVKAAPYTGSVNLKEKAGTQEAQLLAARAVKAVAERIARAVLAQSDAATFYLFPAAQAPTYQHLIGYRFRVQLLTEAFAAAGVAAEHPAPAPFRAHAFGAPGAVSAGLDAVTHLLDFFRTDYEVGGIDTKIDDSLLLYAVAGALRQPAGRYRGASLAYLPLAYGPGPVKTALDGILDALRPLANARAVAGDKAATALEKVASLQAQAADPANAARKNQLLAEADAAKAHAAGLTAVANLYDAFATSLSTPDASGVLPIVAVTQESAIETVLAGGAAVLLLHLESTGGGYLVKKNLFTALGSMPLYHTGGATAAYVLLGSSNGEVLAGDVVAVHGGTVKSSDLARVLESR